jgi:signal transduction histidine kinase
MVVRETTGVVIPLIASAAAGVAAVVGIVASTGTVMDPWWVWVPLQVVGVSFTTSGLVAWLRYRDSAVGRLMVAVGASWFLIDLRYSLDPVLFAVGYCGFYLSSVVFTHLVLALPTGRLPATPERLVVLALYVWAPGTQTIRYFVERPRPPQSWTMTGIGHSVWSPIATVGGLVLAAVALWLVVRRWHRVRGPARLSQALLWVAGALAGVVVLATMVASLVDASTQVLRVLGLVYSLGLSLTPVAILVGIVRQRMARGRVADLVLRLEGPAEPRHLGAALAQALGDPGLEVLFCLGNGNGDGYVDAEGHRAEPPGGSDRTVTMIRRHGEDLAALVHDPVLVDQRPLVDAVVATAGLALENARLHAAQRAQLEEVRASRARIVNAADRERRRIQRDLHDGIQPKLLAVSMLAGQAREELPRHALASVAPAAVLDKLDAHLSDLIHELRQLTEGIHPPALTERGLTAVVETLAERAPLPVELDMSRRRWPDDVERTAYFVINEALANVYRHSAASRAVVRVGVVDGHLRVEVVDDGIGGADPGRGTGLDGLRDRVAALGGTLRIESPSGAGTTIRVELPCGS